MNLLVYMVLDLMTYTVHPDLVGKNTVGYRDLYDQFLIIEDFEDMARAIKKATKV